MDELNERYSKILQFYVLGNKLKTTIFDEKSNYSIADNLFGSIILAIAMDSEFKETDNLGKVIRMLILSEFIKVNLDYDLSQSLEKGNELSQDVQEFFESQTLEAKLAFKYRIWDCFLMDTIKSHDKAYDFNRLIRESLSLFQPKNGEEADKYEQVFRFYYLNQKLKHKERGGWDKNHWNIKSERLERISEHIVDTMLLAIGMNSEFSHEINIDKVLETLAIHETGEILIGDITPFDGVSREKKMAMEHKAIRDCLGNLSEKNKYIKMLLDFDEQQSKEDTFAYFCDKIVADLSSKLYQDNGLHHPLEDQSKNCVFKSEKVQELLANGAKTPFDIWFGCDRTIYEKNLSFPEFFDLLVLAKNMNLANLISRDEMKSEDNLSLKLKNLKQE